VTDDRIADLERRVAALERYVDRLESGSLDLLRRYHPEEAAPIEAKLWVDRRY
jgi:hypothetical protein